MLDYLKGTRHPLSSALFVLPLLLVYEIGVLVLGGSATGNELRNGADAWARSQLVVNGVAFAWALPVLVGVLLLVRLAWGWGERSQRPIACVLGMYLESLIFAAGLWALSRNFLPLLERMGLPTQSIEFQSVAGSQVVRYIGAGVYEEVLFRLGLFGLLWLLLRVALLPKVIALVLAAALGALAFAAAHHLGPAGEPLSTPVFLFRTAAGLVFTAVYVGRGLGVAVGAHAGYNILVGVSVG